MALPNAIFRLLKLVLSIGVTISFVFLLSRLLPAANAPKGMSAFDVATYGSVDAATLNKVRGDYAERAGLNNPLFYVDFIFAGRAEARSIITDPADRIWMEEAFLRHGKIASERFYKVWSAYRKAISPQEVNLLTVKLQHWGSASSLDEQSRQGDDTFDAFNSLKSKSASKIGTAWGSLLHSKAPLLSYVPVIQWVGLENEYHKWISQIVTGNFGNSKIDYQPVTSKIQDAGYISICLGFIGLIIGVLLSYFSAVYFTLHPFGKITNAGEQLLYFLDSVPAFLICLASLGIYLLSGGALSSYLAIGNSFSEMASVLVNPSILLGSVCIALFVIPHVTLQFHRSLRDQTTLSYLRTARAKGYSSKKAVMHHALPNALIPSLTLLSEVLVSLLAGVVIVEITFSLPGLGSLFTSSILSADYPVMIGITLLMLVFRLFIMWLTDLSYAVLDPRMRSN
jgi:peptide/nickel transport system permease protein